MAAKSKPGTNKLANVMVKRMRMENAKEYESFVGFLPDTHTERRVFRIE